MRKIHLCLLLTAFSLAQRSGVRVEGAFKKEKEFQKIRDNFKKKVSESLNKKESEKSKESLILHLNSALTQLKNIGDNDFYKDKEYYFEKHLHDQLLFIDINPNNGALNFLAKKLLIAQQLLEEGVIGKFVLNENGKMVLEELTTMSDEFYNDMNNEPYAAITQMKAYRELFYCLYTPTTPYYFRKNLRKLFEDSEKAGWNQLIGAQTPQDQNKPYKKQTIINALQRVLGNIRNDLQAIALQFYSALKYKDDLAIYLMVKLGLTISKKTAYPEDKESVTFQDKTKNITLSKGEYESAIQQAYKKYKATIDQEDQEIKNFFNTNKPSKKKKKVEKPEDDNGGDEPSGNGHDTRPEEQKSYSPGLLSLVSIIPFCLYLFAKLIQAKRSSARQRERYL
ncbi:MAG: hypothetical protein AAF335_03095 [Bacteroidota bacterium]